MILLVMMLMMMMTGLMKLWPKATTETHVELQNIAVSGLISRSMHANN